MAVNVIQSHNPKILLSVLASVVNTNSDNFLDVLSNKVVIVPNQAVSKWVTTGLSLENGICANIEFVNKILAFKWNVFKQVLSERKEDVVRANLPKAVMKLRIYNEVKPYILSDDLSLDETHPLFSLVQRIYGKGGYKQRHAMLTWLADETATLFSNYIQYRGQCTKDHQGHACNCRSNWLERWLHDQSIDVESLLSTNEDETDEEISLKLKTAQQIQHWQKWLWQRVIRDDYVQIVEIENAFWDALENEATAKQAISRLPKEVAIFTILELPPQHLHFLRRLGQYIDITIFHYNPSQEYWADAVDARFKKKKDLLTKQRFIDENTAKGIKVDDRAINAFFENYKIANVADNRESRHPLLTRFGKQARDHFSLLSELSSGESGAWYDAFYYQPNDSLLGLFQKDMLLLNDPVPNSFPLNENDESIRINVCHSSLRQLEVLKEQLVLWLNQDDSRKVDDILVLTPNIKDVEPTIRNVFASSAGASSIHLPVKITGVASLNVRNAWDSLVGRITLGQGDFTHKDLMQWLSNPATQQFYQLSFDDVTAIGSMLADAGFKRGLDEEHLMQSLGGEDQDFRFTFKYAIERLLLGLTLGVRNQFEGIVAFNDVQLEDKGLIAKLSQIYLDIQHRASWTATDHTEKKQANEWLELIMAEALEYSDAEVVGVDIINRALQSNRRFLTLKYHYKTQDNHYNLQHITMPLVLFLKEVEAEIERNTEAAEPTGFITFAELGQIRPLPYKLVVLLNMDSGFFPHQDKPKPFDLMRLLKPELGDRSRQDDSQGAFLDSVVLAEQGLWLFYNGFDLTTGQQLPPSIVVQEFLDQLSNVVIDESQNDELYVNKDGVEIHKSLAPLYLIHPLHPFDPKGFKQEHKRIQSVWSNVAKNLAGAELNRESWVDSSVEVNAEKQHAIIPSSVWINQVLFPASLFLKSVGVTNNYLDKQVDQLEPIVLDPLEAHGVLSTLLKDDQDDQVMFSDTLPVGKLGGAAWEVSTHQKQSMQAEIDSRNGVTRLDHAVFAISEDLSLKIAVPSNPNQSEWVAVSASKSKGDHAAKAWLNYLLWVAYSEESENKVHTVIFRDVIVQYGGVTKEQAHEYLQSWYQLWVVAQKQPIALPAKLVLSDFGDKELQWADNVLEDSFKNGLKRKWLNTYQIPNGISLDEDKSNSQHRDWAFILNQLNAEELLDSSLDQFSHHLYMPIYSHVGVDRYLQQG